MSNMDEWSTKIPLYAVSSFGALVILGQAIKVAQHSSNWVDNFTFWIASSIALAMVALRIARGSVPILERFIYRNSEITSLRKINFGMSFLIVLMGTIFLAHIAVRYAELISQLLL